MDIHNLAEALFGEEEPAVVGIVHEEVLGQYCRAGRPLEQIQVRVPVSFSVFPVSPDGEPASDEPAGGIPEVLRIFIGLRLSRGCVYLPSGGGTGHRGGVHMDGDKQHLGYGVHRGDAVGPSHPLGEGRVGLLGYEFHAADACSHESAVDRIHDFPGVFPLQELGAVRPYRRPLAHCLLPVSVVKDYQLHYHFL